MTLTAEKRFVFHHLLSLKPGDTLYVRLVSTNNYPLPRLFLSDFGGKPLVFGKVDESSNAVMFSYKSHDGASGLNISLDGTG